MVDLHAEADRHAAMVRPHLEQTGGLESFFIAARPGQAPLALPATFDTIEAKEEGLDVFRALFQELGCSHVAWISEAWVAASSPALADMSPRDRPDRTEALMIVVEDAAGLQAVRIDPFARIEGGAFAGANRSGRSRPNGGSCPAMSSRRCASGLASLRGSTSRGSSRRRPPTDARSSAVSSVSSCPAVLIERARAERRSATNGVD